MKVKDFLKKFKDTYGVKIEFKEVESGASFGFYTKNQLKYNDRFNNENIKEFDTQYINGCILLVIYIK